MHGRPRPLDPNASVRLSKQKQKNTGPELVVRRLVHGLGHRFRIENKDLPGSPDLANRSRRWAMFVHGCYWHHHEGCPRATLPKSNRKWWAEKFEGNRARDRGKASQLRDRGFTVITVWECELDDLVVLKHRLSRELDQTCGNLDE